MRHDASLPMDTILAGLARPGRPVFVRRAEWPRGQWVALERRSGRLVILRDRAAPQETSWRGEAAGPDPATGAEAA